VDRGRDLCATNELCLGRQVDQGEIAGAEIAAMWFIASDSPHLRPDERHGLLSAPLGEVEREVRHPRRLPSVRSK
jgi:hypothetical protein